MVTLSSMYDMNATESFVRSAHEDSRLGPVRLAHAIEYRPRRPRHGL